MEERVHDYHEHLVPYDLSSLGIIKPQVFRNLVPPMLYEEAIRYEKGSIISASGSLAVTSHKYTGRLPKEKRIVRDDTTKDLVHWGELNIPIDDHAYMINRSRALDYLNSRNRIYVVDSFMGWDPRYRMKVRTICSRAYHALFMHNMLIVPNPEELENYGDPDYIIINAGVFPANNYSTGVTSDASIIISFKHKEINILGTEYAGEMKKGLFTVMNYLMPQQDILPMHCAATSTKKGSTTLFFGLSGTGKTTLSGDPEQQLIGDDEHCWTDKGVFNIEGGCYAKCINPPEHITKCITFGALLENLTYYPHTREMDYNDESITTNTRSSYPLSHVSNIKIPALGSHPRNVIFLTCDAFGVLPPVARLNEQQAMYHFISGYTAKTPNTEVGVIHPTAVFSACFGEVFLPLHPLRYAQLFAQFIKKYDATVWLVNTGWMGGNYSSGTRISLRSTQAIVSAICDEKMKGMPTKKDSLFGFEVFLQCKGIADHLDPKDAWDDPEAYDQQARLLADMFRENMKKYGEADFLQGGPQS